MSKKKTDITDLLKKAQEKKKYIAPDPVKAKVKQEVKEGRRNMGRPTDKKEDVEYVKLSARIPVETRKKLRVALADRFADKFRTQDAMINEALLFFLREYKP